MPIQRTVQVNLLDLPIVQELIGKRPDDSLYHYTDRPGLLGIIERRQLWASNARYMNDANELSTAIHLARTTVGNLSFAASNAQTKLKNDILDFLATFERAQDVFVFSLSEKPDLLSQWRAYTQPGNGYSVGFEVNQISQIADRISFHLAPCIYDRTEHGRMLATVIDDTYSTLMSNLDAGAKSLDARSEALGRFAGGFFFIAPIIKDPSFSEECEWRLVQPATSVWAPEVCFRDGRTLMVPYIPISLADGADPIHTVIVGPTPHPELEKRALSGLLTKYGLPEAAVESSVVPYRIW
jgi:hypothetical protein